MYNVCVCVCVCVCVWREREREREREQNCCTRKQLDGRRRPLPHTLARHRLASLGAVARRCRRGTRGLRCVAAVVGDRGEPPLPTISRLVRRLRAAMPVRTLRLRLARPESARGIHVRCLGRTAHFGCPPTAQDHFRTLEPIGDGRPRHLPRRRHVCRRTPPLTLKPPVTACICGGGMSILRARRARSARSSRHATPECRALALVCLWHLLKNHAVCTLHFVHAGSRGRQAGQHTHTHTHTRASTHTHTDATDSQGMTRGGNPGAPAPFRAPPG